jgi:hypothetical protein
LFDHGNSFQRSPDRSGGSIAARWADHRKVPQIAFKPDWTKHAKAAPFKRNDQLLDVLPIGVLDFPGTGIRENLADKARKLGIPVWKFGNSGAKAPYHQSGVCPKPRSEAAPT